MDKSEALKDESTTKATDSSIKNNDDEVVVNTKDESPTQRREDILIEDNQPKEKEEPLSKQEFEASLKAVMDPSNRPLPENKTEPQL